MSFRYRLKISVFAFILLSCFCLVMGKVSASEEALMNSNMTYTYETNVNNPISVSGLITQVGLKVYDNASQEDISDNIVAYDVASYTANVLNQPTSQARRLGKYNCVFKCYDEYGNYSTCTIVVSVIDNTKPVVDEEHSVLVYEFKKSEINANTERMIENNIIATDNNSILLAKGFDTSDFDLYTSIGFYRVPFCIVDDSVNIETIYLEINIIDDIGPTFSADTTYQRVEPSATPLTFAELNEVFNISAFDYESNLACNVVVSTDEYSAHSNEPGLYLYEVSSTDVNNNNLNVKCYIEVVDNEAPRFYIDATKVTITTNVLFTLDDAYKTIRSRKLAKNDNFVLSVKEDEYTESYDKIGTYKYVVQADYEDDSNDLIEFLIEVKESLSEISEKVEEEIKEEIEVKVGFFKSVFNFIKNGLKMIWNVIKWPFSKIKNVILKNFRLFS